MSETMIDLICENENCTREERKFQKTLGKYNLAVKRGSRLFCSRACFYAGRQPFKVSPKTKINCDYCGEEFEKFQSQIKLTKNHFCKEECSAKYLTGKRVVEYIEVECDFCKKKFSKRPSCFRYFKSIGVKNFYCSRLCKQDDFRKFLKDKTFKLNFIKKFCFNRKHRSKIEAYVESQIKDEFPNLSVKYNESIEGYSLDIYICELELAIEINGPVHYLPIYGFKHLIYIKYRDAQRALMCKNNKIKLEIVKVLKDTRIIKHRNQCWNSVRTIILSKMEIEKINISANEIVD